MTSSPRRRAIARVFGIGMLAMGCTPGGEEVTASVHLVPVDESSPVFAQVVAALRSAPRGDVTVEAPASSGLGTGPSERWLVYGASAAALLEAVEATGIASEPEHGFAANCSDERASTPRRCELLYLDESAALRTAAGARARVREDPNSGREVVVMALAEADAAAFEHLTRDYVGHRLAIRLDDEILSSPVVNEPIAGGTLWITPGATDPAYPRRILAALTRREVSE